MTDKTLLALESLSLEPVPTFTEQAVKKYRYSDVNDLLSDHGLERLAEFIRDFEGEPYRRFDRLDDYYQVANSAIYQRPRRSRGKADNRIAHPYGRMITNFLTGYTLGNPVIISSDNEAALADITAWNRERAIDPHNKDIMIDNCVYGRSYELTYRNRFDEDKVARISPKEAFLIFDQTVEDNVIAGVRLHSEDGPDGTVKIATVYTDAFVYEFERQGRLELRSYYPHPYGEVPLNMCKLNRDSMGAFEPVISQIDGYDSMQSSIVDYMQELSHAKLLVTGPLYKDMSDEEARELARSDVILGDYEMSPDNKQLVKTEAEYITKKYDVNGAEAHLKRLENDIYNGAGIPNLNDEHFSGNNSGVALQYKTYSLQFMFTDIVDEFKKFLRRRYRILQRSWSITGNSKPAVIEFMFTPNLPKGIWDEIEAFCSAGGQLSNGTLLSLLSFVGDTQEEMAKLQKETERSYAG